MKSKDNQSGINWRKLASRIPHRVQISANLYYDVVFVARFDNPTFVGLCRQSKHTIYIKTGQSSKETVLTYLHELLHAFSDENDIRLTERQVGLLERKMLTAVLKRGNIFI